MYRYWRLRSFVKLTCAKQLNVYLQLLSRPLAIRARVSNPIEYVMKHIFSSSSALTRLVAAEATQIK